MSSALIWASSAASIAALFCPTTPGAKTELASLPNWTAPKVFFWFAALPSSSFVPATRRFCESNSAIDPESSRITSMFCRGTQLVAAVVGPAMAAAPSDAANRATAERNKAGGRGRTRRMGYTLPRRNIKTQTRRSCLAWTDCRPLGGR